MFTRLPIVIVGLSFGQHILRWFHESDAVQYFQLVGVSDLRQSLAAEVAAQYGVRAYSSLEEVLRDDSVAVVGLYTAPFGRAQLLRDILRAGKDVMTTKPFELDADEAGLVLEEARRLNRVIHLNSPSQEPTQDIRCIGNWVDKHGLGKLISARGEVWASYFEDEDGSWMDDAMLCPGGVMMRLGIYLINDILRLAGPVDQINLISSRVRTGRPTPDNALLTLTGRSGYIASVYASFCIEDGDRYSNGLVLNYENGTIYRNIGETCPVPKQDHAHLALVLGDEHGRRVAETADFYEISGVYQWENLYHSIINRTPVSDEYARMITEGVKILSSMAGALVEA